MNSGTGLEGVTAGAAAPEESEGITVHLTPLDKVRR
jgi:hypothetical protein